MKNFIFALVFLLASVNIRSDGVNMVTYNTVLNIVTQEVNANATAKAHNADPAEIATAVFGEASSRGVDPLLVLAHIKLESAFDPLAYRWEDNVNASSTGLMQILSSTARIMGFTGSEGELMDVKTNVALGTRYIRDVQARFGYEGGIIAYNAGRVIYTTQTQNYLRLVKKYHEEFKLMAGQTTTPGTPATVTSGAKTVALGIFVGGLIIFFISKLTRKG